MHMLVFHAIKHYSGLRHRGLLFHALQIQKKNREQLYFKAQHGIQSMLGQVLHELSSTSIEQPGQEPVSNTQMSNQASM